MVQPEMTPMRQVPTRGAGARHISADDLELPPLPGSSTESGSAAAEEIDKGSTARLPRRAFAPLLIAAGLVTALALGSWLWRGGPAETNHPNWRPVAAAAQASAEQGASVVVQRELGGTLRQATAVRMSFGDVDLATTHAVREALAKNDLNGANTALRNGLGATAVKDPQTKAVLNPNSRIITAIRDGSAQFFHLRLFDCCDEDGDVVDLSVDGCSYGAVPLTHQGKVISIPLTPGTTVITLRGVRDGGGSITVSFQTSQGDYFSQPLDVGEECQIGVVVQ